MREENVLREKRKSVCFVFKFSLSFSPLSLKPPRNKYSPDRVQRRVLIVEPDHEAQRDAAGLCCCRRGRRRRSFVFVVLAFFALAPTLSSFLLCLLLSQMVQESSAVGVSRQREPHSVPRSPGGVPLRRDGPNLFQAQGVRLRLGADPAAASSLLPQLELFLCLSGEGAPRALGQQRRPGPDLDAAGEPAAVRDTVFGDPDVPGDDSGDGPFGISSRSGSPRSAAKKRQTPETRRRRPPLLSCPGSPPAPPGTAPCPCTFCCSSAVELGASTRISQREKRSGPS